MIDSSLKAIEQDRERESKINIENSEDEDEVYDYPGDKTLTDEDYVEFEEMKQQETEKDKEYLREVE